MTMLETDPSMVATMAKCRYAPTEDRVANICLPCLARDREAFESTRTTVGDYACPRSGGILLAHALEQRVQ